MVKWHQFRLFSALHITECSYNDDQSQLTALWWFPASCLPSQASWSRLKTTRAPVDTRQARERGFSKSRPLSLWQWYKHELLIYCCICQMAMKIETWNCVYTRPPLANPVTYNSTKFWRGGGILAYLMDLPATATDLTSKCITLHHNIQRCVQLPKNYHPMHHSSSFIHKNWPLQNFALYCILLMLNKNSLDAVKRAQPSK